MAVVRLMVEIMICNNMTSERQNWVTMQIQGHHVVQQCQFVQADASIYLMAWVYMSININISMHKINFMIVIKVRWWVQ